MYEIASLIPKPASFAYCIVYTLHHLQEFLCNTVCPLLMSETKPTHCLNLKIQQPKLKNKKKRKTITTTKSNPKIQNPPTARKFRDGFAGGEANECIRGRKEIRNFLGEKRMKKVEMLNSGKREGGDACIIIYALNIIIYTLK